MSSPSPAPVGVPHFNRNVPQGGCVVEVVLDGEVVVGTRVVVVGAPVVVVEVTATVVVVGASVVVVLAGSVAAAPPHGFGWQVPGPRSMPPFSRHARGVFTRHLVTPLARVWQHWIGSWRRWRPAEAGCTPARRRVQAMTP